jgi:hypothetical protein
MKKILFNFLIGSLAISLLGVLGWLSYRDRQPQMEQYFGVILPSRSKILPLMHSNEGHRDDPRFRFSLHPDDFQEFSQKIKKLGFSGWVENGGQYGSFNEESKDNDPLLYSYKNDGRVKLMLFYRRSTGVVDAVTFFN